MATPTGRPKRLAVIHTAFKCTKPSSASTGTPSGRPSLKDENGPYNHVFTAGRPTFVGRDIHHRNERLDWRAGTSCFPKSKHSFGFLATFTSMIMQRLRAL
jgi:hypothetical protein